MDEIKKKLGMTTALAISAMGGMDYPCREHPRPEKQPFKKDGGNDVRGFSGPTKDVRKKRKAVKKARRKNRK